MALWTRNGKNDNHDVALERQAAGTLGGEHLVTSTVGGKAASSVITPLDSRLTYGGSWGIIIAQNINNFLGYQARSSTSGDNITLQFSGTSIAIVGNTGPAYGRYNVYIDGVLAYGKVNTTIALAASYFTTGGLNTTDTTINTGDPAVAGFVAPGTIVIDDEEITYTGIGATSFTGCTRGANGTTPAIHQAATTIYGANTNVEGYSQYYQDRIITWRKSNLSPGQHTLKLVIRADKNASSSAYDIDIGGFLVGGAIGAQNILTNIRYITVGPYTSDANGLCGPTALQPADASQQALTVISAYPTAGANWAFPMFNPTTGAYYFVTNKASTAGISLVLGVLYMGTTF